LVQAFRHGHLTRFFRRKYHDRLIINITMMQGCRPEPIAVLLLMGLGLAIIFGQMV
jgi:hypothetical protein